MVRAKRPAPPAVRRHRRIADEDDLVRLERRRVGAFALLGLRPAREQGTGGDGDKPAHQEKPSPPLISRQTPARKLAAGDASKTNGSATPSGGASRWEECGVGKAGGRARRCRWRPIP